MISEAFRELHHYSCSIFFVVVKGDNPVEYNC